MRYSPELMIFHMAKHASVLSYREVCRTVKMAYRLEITKGRCFEVCKMAGRLFSDRERYRLFRGDEQPKKSRQIKSTWKEMVCSSRQHQAMMNDTIQT